MRFIQCGVSGEEGLLDGGARLCSLRRSDKDLEAVPLTVRWTEEAPPWKTMPALRAAAHGESEQS